MKHSELIRILTRYGWRPKEGKKTGPHDKYVHPDFDYFIPVPRHPSQEISDGLLHHILKRAGIE